jgi:predicted MFS family arabinose efflux permease
MPTDQSRIWTRDFALLFVSSLFTWSSFYFLMPTLPVYVEAHLGGTPAHIGLMSSLLTLSAIVSRPVAGYGLDRWGRRGLQLGLLALFAVAACSYRFAGSIAALAMVRLFHGIPFGGATTAQSTVASDLVPPRMRGEGLGLFGLANNLAMAVGPAVGLGLLASDGFAGLFNAATIMAILGLGLAWMLSYPKVRHVDDKLCLSVLVEQRVGWLSAATLLAYTGYGGVITFITLYATQYGIRNSGWFFTAYSAGLVLARSIAGRMFDRHGARPTVILGLVHLFTAYATLALLPGLNAYLAGALLLGLGFGTLNPSVSAMAVNLVPPERRGAATATLGAAIDVGVGMGSILLGALASMLGNYAHMFAAAGALLLLPGMLFAIRVLPDYARGALEQTEI